LKKDDAKHVQDGEKSLVSMAWQKHIVALKSAPKGETSDKVTPKWNKACAGGIGRCCLGF